ncbi:MAG: DNA adenine methylase [Planctomycetes bacterium RIFOXYD2_FULL_41_16]|nr:MAG: DNA adenine methylase [Planctomycetes bacterium RBG_16_41_13]OHC05843.1 MAG: DNA adenine methylase [Planctomycetes bacterium RIFOXYC2_FULL_41_27]OHC08184.1 MAG: DNA adenine methylase [Planctomycetes bacterium RIFOXYD2_FULL_41_16]
MKLPHPIQYQGSKRSLASVILRYFPNKFPRLVEPFSGSAAISIACAARGKANSYWINDLNKPLAELLGLIINHPVEIANYYETIWNQQHDDPIEHYYRVREDFNRTGDPRLFLYLLARCAKGSVRYNTEGLFNQSPDKRRHGTRPETMRDNIFGVSTLLKGKSVISSLDYKDVLSNVNEDDVVYMDPPYQGVCGDRDSRYFSGISYEEFLAALSELNVRQIRYAVSYDGRTGNKTFGNRLPESLSLTLIELEAGRSSQATLLGRDAVTVESLYLSSRLAIEVKASPYFHRKRETKQLVLMETRRRYAAKISKRIP